MSEHIPPTEAELEYVGWLHAALDGATAYTQQDVERFCGEARRVWPRLVAEVHRLRAENEQLHALLAEMGKRLGEGDSVRDLASVWGDKTVGEIAETVWAERAGANTEMGDGNDG